MGKTIISWNVNGIRAIQKKGMLEWFMKEQPDILCIQETKAHPDQLEEGILKPDGYKSYWASAEKKGYSGVACFVKEEPLAVHPMGDDRFDSEGRVLALEYPDYVLINAYFPNSQNQGRRLDYKIAFCDKMLELCDAYREMGKNVVLCGDYNIAHKEIDLKNPKSNEDSPGFLPEEREWMDRFVAAGYVDAFRLFTEEGDHYTWWSYRTRARERNVGWRIDLHCVNEEFQDQVKSCSIMDEVMGSDHCPVKILFT